MVQRHHALDHLERSVQHEPDVWVARRNGLYVQVFRLEISSRGLWVRVCVWRVVEAGQVAFGVSFLATTTTGHTSKLSDAP